MSYDYDDYHSFYFYYFADYTYKWLESLWQSLHQSGHYNHVTTMFWNLGKQWNWYDRNHCSTMLMKYNFNGLCQRYWIGSFWNLYQFHQLIISFLELQISEWWMRSQGYSHSVTKVWPARASSADHWIERTAFPPPRASCNRKTARLTAKVNS